MKYLLLSLAFFMLISGTSAQIVGQAETSNPDSTFNLLNELSIGLQTGKVSIIQDQRIWTLLEKHRSYNDSIGIYGWKVVLYNGRQRNDANNAVVAFIDAFPDLPYEPQVIYPEPPDFKTLVGAFRTKEEAFKLQQEIKRKFPFCYLMQLRLEKGELD